MYTPTVPSAVRCPADRGDEPYTGTALDVGDAVHSNHRGDPFRWVTVRHPRGHSVVWPSNRLTAA